MKSYKFTINGKVQKVSYRIYTSNNASQFNGYVKNLSNGDIEACITCDKKDLDTFTEILKKGSPNSRVDNITRIEINDIFKDGFKIKY